MFQSLKRLGAIDDSSHVISTEKLKSSPSKISSKISRSSGKGRKSDGKKFKRRGRNRSRLSSLGKDGSYVVSRLQVSDSSVANENLTVDDLQRWIQKFHKTLGLSTTQADYLQSCQIPSKFGLSLIPLKDQQAIWIAENLRRMLKSSLEMVSSTGINRRFPEGAHEIWKTIHQMPLRDDMVNEYIGEAEEVVGEALEDIEDIDDHNLRFKILKESVIMITRIHVIAAVSKPTGSPNERREIIHDKLMSFFFYFCFEWGLMSLNTKYDVQDVAALVAVYEQRYITDIHAERISQKNLQ